MPRQKHPFLNLFGKYKMEEKINHYFIFKIYTNTFFLCMCLIERAVKIVPLPSKTYSGKAECAKSLFVLQRDPIWTPQLTSQLFPEQVQRWQSLYGITELK